MANSNFIVQNGLTVGPLTIDATSGNISTSGAISSTNTGPTSFSGAVTVLSTSNFSGNVNTNNIMPFGNANANIGSTALQYNTVFAKATSAQYADLAENYLADNTYAPGTVVVFGGDAEITISNQTHDTRVAGIVSTNPAYLMNSGLKNATPVAFTGRVPCRVMGPITKGQLIVQGMNWGIAEALNPDYFAPGCVLGKALEEIADNSIQTIEVVAGRF